MKNDICRSNTDSSKNITLLATKSVQAVGISDDGKITIVSKAKDISTAVSYALGFFLLLCWAMYELGDFFMFNFFQNLPVYITGGIVLCAMSTALLLAIVERAAVRQLILDPVSGSIDINTAFAGLILSRKKDFRKGHDLVEVQLKVQDYTSDQFEEFLTLCNLPDSKIPSIVFHCDLLLDDETLIDVFRLNFVGQSRTWRQDYHNDLLQNENEPHSFLSVIETAEEIAKTLQIPLRILFRDSVFKGKESPKYIDS
jgi:hypothetical protein